MLLLIKPDSVKIASLQTAFAYLITKGDDGFIDMIFDETNRDKLMIYYQAAVEKNMKAQNYNGITILHNNGCYYLCSYTNPVNAAIALQDLCMF